MKNIYMFKSLLFIIVFLFYNHIFSQNVVYNDTIMINKTIQQAMDIVGTKPDSAIRHFQNVLYKIKKMDRQALSKKTLNSVDERYGFVLHQLGNVYLNKAKYPMALYYYQQSLSIREKINDIRGLSATFNNMGLIYFYLGKTDSSFFYYKKSLSLRQQLKDTLLITASLDNLAILYGDLGMVDSALYYFEQCLQMYQNKQLYDQVARTYNNIGIIYKNRGNIPYAVQNYHKGLKIAEQNSDSSNIANLYANLGQVYQMQDDLPKALYYYKNSLAILTNLGDLRRKSHILNNIAIIFHNSMTENTKNKIYASNDSLFQNALDYYNKSLDIKQKINDKHGIATTVLDIGNLKYEISKTPGFNPRKAAQYKQNALENYKKALQYYTEINNTYGMASAMNTIAQYYYENNAIAMSIPNVTEAYKLAKKSGYIELIRNSAQLLNNLYYRQGNYKLAFQFYDEYITLRDSIDREENYKLTQQQHYQMMYEKQAVADSIAHADQLAIKNLEISRNQEKMKKQRLIIFISIFGFLAIAAFLMVLYRMFTQKKKANFLLSQQNLKIMNLNKAIKKERDVSENLLLNILPYQTALELKANGAAVPKFYESVSVLFTDFKGFTKACAGLSPQEIVNELHMYFEIFDNIIEKYKLEKIKTIGDAYMCAGGLPVENATHPIDIVNAGLEMQQFMHNLKEQRIKAGLNYWELRIGIHSGSVVDGVVGKKKFAYDIWGSAVNIASRMESAGEAGKVNISNATYSLVKDFFMCTYRGKIEAKSLGSIDMYFVEGKK